MGGLNAVDYVQIAHINALRSDGCMGDDATMTYARPVPNPADGVYESVVVDEYSIIAVVDKDTVASGADTDRTRAADAVYASEGRRPDGSDHRPGKHAPRLVWSCRVG